MEQRDIFGRAAHCLYKRCRVCGLGFSGSERVRRDLEELYPGEGLAQRQAEYAVGKLRLMLLILCVGLVISALMKLRSLTGGRIGEDGSVQRQDYGGGDQRIELEVERMDGERAMLSLELQERQLTAQEAETLEQAFQETLSELILGNNPSLEQVSGDLTLEESWESYPFTVTWKSSNYQVISRSGRVYPQETSVRVILTALFQYADMSWTCEIPVTVVPAGEAAEDSFQELAQKALNQLEESTREESTLTLPEQLDGQQVNWREVRQDNSAMLLLLTAAAMAAVYIMKDRDLHAQTGERKLRMKRTYPVILNKFTLYLGAGMTIRGAFRKIALDYQRSHGNVGDNPAYEEMLYACNELQAGVSESAVYENFGRRSGLREYARFCTMLNQNLRKGNAALLGRLREEQEKALTQDLQLRRKQGEEAGTRLLIPMIMMMAIVMLLVMIPAFGSMNL